MFVTGVQTCALPIYILLSRAGRDEQALMTTIAGLVVVLVLVIQKISELFALIKQLFSF